MLGLQLLAQLIKILLPRLRLAPAEIFLAGDSKCIIAMIEANDCLLDVWFTNRVAEVKDEMAAWQREEIHVNPLHHWPGLQNIADLATKGKTQLDNVKISPSRQRT